MLACHYFLYSRVKPPGPLFPPSPPSRSRPSRGASSLRQFARGGMYSNYIQVFRRPGRGGWGPSRSRYSRRGRPLRGNPLRFPRARLGACPRELQSSPDHSAGSVNRGRFPPNRVCIGRMRVRSPRTRGRFAVSARPRWRGRGVRADGYRTPTAQLQASRNPSRRYAYVTNDDSATPQEG